jgi:ABC-2 type transport system ATP-binding protein
MTTAIETRALRKVYPAPSMPRRSKRGHPAGHPGGPPSAAATDPEVATREVVALDALDLVIPEGEFFGLLGPNGAGKTTTIGILTTRVHPTGGEARVAGLDVVRDPVGARLVLGVVPQRPNPDRQLSVEDNLLFHASYYGVPAGVARQRATQLLEQFAIAERRAAKPDQLSGGQQQRLMIARALIHAPRVIFLDEPTVGLDPQARIALWEVLRGLHADGRTIVLTTHYMEEADRLCERLAIVDDGRLLALDTPAALKARAPGGTLVELALDGEAGPLVDDAARVDGVSRAEAQGTTLRAEAARGGAAIPPLLDVAEAHGRTVHDIRLVPPSLESLFVSLTGRSLA